MIKKYDGILIIGPKEFIKQTTKALELIKKKSKRDFTKITNYLKSIKYSKSSGMDLEKSQFNVGKKSAFQSIEWYASIIIHDTHHYFLHNVKGFLWKKENYEKHEKLCLKEQIRFLKKIKAQRNMLDYLNSVLKTKYWEIKKREW